VLQSNTSTAPRSVQEAADQVFGLLRGGARDQKQAALFMDGVLGRWMDHYFRRLGVPEDEAEELTMDVWVKVLAARYEDRGNGFALLCRMRHSRYVEYLRARHADKRTGGSVEGLDGVSEVQGDEDFWNIVLDTVAAPAAPEGLEDCVQRKFQLFQRVAPARASLLELLAEGLSYREVAGVVFDLEEAQVTNRYVARIRNRIEEARRQAEPYFEECQD
jgi:DNA-directed RNA polymerase specialized sigma24 family protein